ncbi:DNA polymerase beta superfamily protein [Roseibacillus persicicus]|uniref:DNA polymerase beta superfamily protein n=1 Tax=Roseibacillus persicicus TaxID=454148 RepID=UPI00280F5E06|nr:nucleotidyltransferase domain-containing protein [Roseibacillus persicicus]MDQ8188740.1 nucleotidyltransferase domain-containing protein [Roseibacillus persicicus]
MDRLGDINELLESLERKHQVTILYACESGSRAWGFASPDSDYDIRFLYARREPEYLRVFPGGDTIEVAIEDDLDPGGWDIRKAAGLLAKSNGALVEWLHSPIVYRAGKGFLELWQKAARDAFSPHANASHYRGLAVQIWKGKCQGDQLRAKDYLYVLRALFSAEWVLENQSPAPVDFNDLRGERMAEAFEELLEWKSRSGESELMPRSALIDEVIEATFAKLESLFETVGRRPLLPQVCERLFRKTLALSNESPAAFRTIGGVRASRGLLFDAVAGSRAYGTDHARSDEDRRGVFVAPNEIMLGFEPVTQVSDEKSDEVYYELRRFGELLLKNNPNALELLAMPEDCIRFQAPAFSLLTPSLFLSKLCGQTYANYAMGQIRKARGLNKEIVNPQPEKRKSLLDFCYVLEGQGSVALTGWLHERGLLESRCGLVGVEHAPGTYALFYDDSSSFGYRGIVSKKDDSALLCSSVPREARPIAWVSCNSDAYKAHCKSHREYWQWVELRNEERYQTNTEHGRGYDSKNLMHTLRLLDMAEEIATEGLLRVRRPNREWLMRVRAGEFSYEELVARAEEQVQRVEEAFAKSTLPARPDEAKVSEVLHEIRNQ